MTPKQKSGCVLGILSSFLIMPMWFWLLYQILQRVNATETMWLIYYVYVPLSLVLNISFKIVESIFDDK